MTADAGRRAALHLLTAALAKRRGLEAALDDAQVARLSPQDRAFARALAMTALRQLGPIDRALQARLQRPPPEAVQMILRLGAAQLFFLDTPAYAAVDASVALAAELAPARPFKGLVNAVLRRLQREGLGPAEAQDLAPSWLFARWSAAFGEAGARAIAAVIADEPPTDVTPRDPAEAAILAQSLDASVLPGGSLRRSGRGRIEDWPGFSDGRWWVQDAAAAIPARLLAVQAGETVLDLCAAPGGKTLQLAARGPRVTALDKSAARLKRLEANLARTRLEAEVVAADAAAWTDGRTFDAVLLDAPCSSTGTFRRNPDVLWTLRPPDIAKLADVQARLLDAAADRVGPDGRLVYCVCSLEPEEGEAQIAPFLARNPSFRLAPMTAGEGGAPAPALRPDGWLRILPPQLDGGVDGFFIARFQRTR
jgi:16S rRNA (cytosine967-C5)-methyltransferase